MRKVFRTAAAVAAGSALAAAGAVTSVVPAEAATGCNASFATYATLKVGSSGAQTKAAECLLAAAGFSATVDGHFSKADGKALGAFRHAAGFANRPVAGPRTWEALLAAGTTPALKQGDKNADVLRLQDALRAAKFSKVSIGGTYDASTTAAVKAAQKSLKLTQTGAADAKLWKALQAGKVHAGQASATKKATKSHPKASSSSSSKGLRALAFAKRQLGDRYSYGAAGPNSWDCSGLTMKAWKAAGVSLPHSARAQFHKGKKVSRNNLKKGDLVFFYSGISHVAIYAGDGKVIHASRPGRPVAYIKMKYMPFEGARRLG